MTILLLLPRHVKETDHDTHVGLSKNITEILYIIRAQELKISPHDTGNFKDTGTKISLYEIIVWFFVLSQWPSVIKPVCS